MTKAEITLGQRVLITGDHPWRDHAGTVIGFECFRSIVGTSSRGSTIWTGEQTTALIQLDSGGTCYVHKPENLMRLPE